MASFIASPVAFDDQRPASVGAVRAKKPRRWGQSCLECRRRKKGCEGRDKEGNSLCTYCPTFGLTCVFQKQSEPNRVRDLEVRVTRMQDFIKSLADGPPEEKAARLTAWLKDPLATEAVRVIKRRKKVEEDPSPSPTLYSPSLLPSPTPPTPLYERPPGLPPCSDADTAVRMRALFDAAGFDLARGALERPPTARALDDSDGEIDAQHGGQLRDPAMHYDEHWPREGLPPLERPISYEAAREMLDLYFCWWNPRWNIIDQPVFEQSMERGDNLYCTPFLLTAIFSVTAPHSFHSSDRQDEFGARAHFLLGQELYAAKPRVTTVQALLCLAAFASDKTRHPQSYNFVGFAMRMLDELSFDNEAALSPVEREVRRRCGWFCFGCDKMVSLTMSRPPRHPVRLLPPLPDINPALDAQPWLAVRHQSRLERHRAPLEHPQPSMQSSCARYWCEAQLFFDEVLHQIYARGLDNAAESKAFVLSMRERFSEWQASLPRSCFLRLSEMPLLCPPAHIIYLNLTIRVIGLLLYKPFMHRHDVGIPCVDQECARLAEETHMLFRLYDTAFPPALSTLNVLHVFAAFSAAHIDVLRLRDERTSPRERQILVERVSFTARLMTEGAGFGVGLSLAKLKAQQDAALKEHRGRYDPIRDPHNGHVTNAVAESHHLLPHHTAPMQAQVQPHLRPHDNHHYGQIDFSSLSEDMFAENFGWPAFQQDETVSRVLRELQEFADHNNHTPVY